MKDNVREFPRSVGGGDGGSTEDRLRAVEDRLRVVELDVREIKTDLKHIATRAWVLAGVLGGMGIAAGIAVAVARLLF